MENKNYKYSVKMELNQNAFKSNFSAYENMQEVKEPLTYDRDTGKGKKNGLFDTKIFKDNAFGKITMPEELFGKLSIYSDDKEYAIEVIPVLAPRYRFDSETDVVTEAYRKLILRRNRLRRLIDAKAPELVMQSEIDLLLEAVIEVLHKVADTFELLSEESIESEFYNKITDLGFLA